MDKYKYRGPPLGNSALNSRDGAQVDVDVAGGTGVQREVRIVDLSDVKRTGQPIWLVRRAAEIVVHNARQLTTEELRSLSAILMNEAGSRSVLGEER